MKIRKKNDPQANYVDKVPFNLTSRQINSEERKNYQVFLSHSNADAGETVEKVAKALSDAGVNCNYDRVFLSGGDNFQKVIEENIHCYAGVVLVTPGLLQSSWCNYEIGYFRGHHLAVFLYDPDNLIEKESSRGNHFLKYQLHDYLPAYTSLNELVTAVRDTSVYSGLFSNETECFTKRDFSEALAKKVDTSVVRISSPFFDKDQEAFAECHFGTLVINFGTFKTTVKRGRPCYAVKGKSECFNPDNSGCALVPIRQITEENMECVLLNHVLYNGTVCHEDRLVLEFHVPVHKKFGTEFKFIVDVPNNDKLYRLMNIFECAGMNPGLSESCNGGRIFLAIPERETQGVFNIRGEFNNNFICPRALIDRENKE